MTLLKKSFLVVDKTRYILRFLSVAFVVLVGVFSVAGNKSVKEGFMPNTIFDGPNRAHADIPYSSTSCGTSCGTSCDSSGGSSADCTSANCVGGCSNSDGSSVGSVDSGSTSGSCGASTSSNSAGGCGCNGSDSCASSGTGCGLF